MHSIGVVISTQGRETLRHTLDSILMQGLIPEDKIIVVGDGIPGEAFEVAKLVHSYGSQFAFENRKRIPDTWGHHNMNYGFDALRGIVDRICAQDDDDVFAPRIFDIIRQESEKNPDALLMTRILNHTFGLLWREPRWGVPLFEGVAGDVYAKNGYNAQDGHSPFMPGKAARIPHFGDAYNGDQILLLQAQLLYPEVVWLDCISTITRPEKVMKWRLRPVLVTDKNYLSLSAIRNTCADDMTGFTAPITDEMQHNWWETKDPRTRAWLFDAGKEGDYWAGFAVYRPWGDNFTISYGVHPSHRGKGYGREILQFVTFAGQGPMKAETLPNNNASLHIMQGNGWTITGVPSYKRPTQLELQWPPMKMIAKAISSV